MKQKCACIRCDENIFSHPEGGGGTSRFEVVLTQDT